jgi:hypothetical protein
VRVGDPRRLFQVRDFFSYLTELLPYRSGQVAQLVQSNAQMVEGLRLHSGVSIQLLDQLSCRAEDVGQFPDQQFQPNLNWQS